MVTRRTKSANSGLFSPYEFPCGLKVNNRLVKAPMYEHLSNFLGGPPNAYHLALYSSWSRHGWGMIITGNVQVSGSHLTLGRDLVVPDQLNDTSLRPFKALSRACKGPDGRTLAIMQLSHAGRQSPNLLGGRYPFMPPLAPSPIPVGLRVTKHDPIALMVQSVLFQTPKEMSFAEIDNVAKEFVNGAYLAHLSGFDGVELHAAHGYLLAQFLSPKTNKRQDKYSLQSESGLLLLRQIVDGIRAAVPSRFIVGVKLNASDYLPDDPETEQNRAASHEEIRALNHVLALAGWGTIDFIDFSGGDYENPTYMAPSASAPGRRQVFFAQLSHQALKSLDSAGIKYTSRPAIILTGGFRTPNLLRSALRSGHADLLGIGRCSIMCPRIPEVMRCYEQDQGDGDGDAQFGAEPDFSTSDKYLKRWPVAPLWSSLSKVKLIGAGLDLAWYTIVLRRLSIAELRGSKSHDESPRPNQEPDYPKSALRTLFQLYFWMPDTSREAKPSRTPFDPFAAAGLLAFLIAACFFIFIQPD